MTVENEDIREAFEDLEDEFGKTAKYKWHIGLKFGELPHDFFRWDKERQFELLKKAAAKRPDAEKVIGEYNPHVVEDCTVSLFEGGKWVMETHDKFGYARLAEKMED